MYRCNLLLDQFQLLRFQELLWDSLRVALGTEAQRPQLLAELCSILIEEASKLNLQDFDLWL